MGTDPLMWRDFPLYLQRGPKLNSFFGINRLIKVRIEFPMTTCFRLTGVRSVTVQLVFNNREHLGFLPHHVVVQERAGVDISAIKNSRVRGWKRDAAIAADISLVEAVILHLPNVANLTIDLGGSMASLSPWTNSTMVDEYLFNLIEGRRLRNICARMVHKEGPTTRYHYWTCLDESAEDFIKSTMAALVLDVFITSLPGRHLPPAIFPLLFSGAPLTPT